MATLRPELKQILDRYGIDPRDKSQLWDCHGTLVLYHRAYEIIAAKEGITFEPPQVVEGNGEKKIVSLLVVGRMGDRSEWSFGEAVPANCKNAYPYATAEKRAKDRVIAKLVGLAQYVYSEDEADEFKDGPRQPAMNGTAPPAAKEPPPQNGTAKPPRDDAFFKRDSYEIKPTAVDGWTTWEKWFRAAAESCKTYAEWTKLEDDNLNHRNKYTAKAPADVCNSLLAFVREIDGRLNPALKP